MLVNQPIAFHRGQVIPVDADHLRGFIANCLRAVGYEQINTPRRSHKITASIRQEYHGMNRYVFKYRLEIRSIEESGNECTLDYELFEEGQSQGRSEGQKILQSLVKNIAMEAQDWASIRKTEKPRETYGNRRFATELELLEAGYITDIVEPERLLLAPFGDNQFITIPKAQTCWHALICGPTGAGKSSGFFIPNLTKRTTSSAIVTEATAGDEIPELYQKTSGWRHFKKNNIYFFNPGYARGTRINPLDKMKMASADDFAAVADELAQLVIVNTTPPTTQRADPIWDKAEKHLLWIMIMHVAASGDPELAHFGAIRELVRKSESEIARQLQASKSDIAGEEFNSFVAHSSDNFRHGVFAGLLQRLNPWLTDRVVTMTKTTDLNIDQLRHERFTFYLSVPSRKAHLKPIAALVFNFLLDLALETQFDFPLALVLDEFTNFGAIPGIDDALSIIRKRNLPVILGVQTFKQIEKTYGRDVAGQIISQLATRVFFRQRHPETAQAISSELGMQTLVQEDTSDTGMTSIREIGRPLLSAADILSLREDQVLIMTPTTNPLLTERFTHKTFPAPDQYDAPELPEHHLVKAGKFVPQAQADEMAQEAKKKAKVSEVERDFIKHKEEMHGDLEAQRTKKKKSWADQDWNIPG